MKKISIVINADDRLGHISPEIYGHFSEHLGRCIYNGIYGVKIHLFRIQTE